jgi:hypothetical protein
MSLLKYKVCMNEFQNNIGITKLIFLISCKLWAENGKVNLKKMIT